MNNPAFSAIGISKSFQSREGASIDALDNLALEAPSGEITSVLGPTASGKTTFLRIMAGLEEPDAGDALVAGKPPRLLRGEIGYVTQTHSLFPWMKVIENVGLPLELKGEQKNVWMKKASEICMSLGLQDALNLYPYELSGGMRQRAMFGRLLAQGAKYWLMDEPFSSLDERTQHAMQKLLLDIAKTHGLSVLFVTHLIDEAVFLGDRVVMLSAGPGRVTADFRPSGAKPRNRLSDEYGADIERARRSLESVIETGE